jgi:hypothetical protein
MMERQQTNTTPNNTEEKGPNADVTEDTTTSPADTDKQKTNSSTPSPVVLPESEATVQQQQNMETTKQ